MRTVSFSEPGLQNALNKNFVNTYTNIEGTANTGESIRHRPQDAAGNCLRGNGKQNVQAIFLTPQGEILHAATGFLSGPDLYNEAQFAFELFNKLKSAKPDKRYELVADSHRKRIDERRDATALDGMPIQFLTRNGLSGGNNPLVANGSGNRNFQNSGLNVPLQDNSGLNMLTDMLQRESNRDQLFSVEYPLMPYQQLDRDPAKLVGNGNSFFASSSSGN